MDIVLTREEKSFLAVLYEEYCKRRQHGALLDDAGKFESSKSIQADFFPKMREADVNHLCRNLSEIEFLSYERGDDEVNNIDLTRKCIAYLDNEFTSGVKGAVDFLAGVSSLVSWLM